MELYQKHRAKLNAILASADVVHTADCKTLSYTSDDQREKSDDEGSDFHLHTGDTTEAETDLDETEDEGSDLEYDHANEERGHAKDHNP